MTNLEKRDLSLKEALKLNNLYESLMENSIYWENKEVNKNE